MQLPWNLKPKICAQRRALYLFSYWLKNQDAREGTIFQFSGSVQPLVVHARDKSSAQNKRTSSIAYFREKSHLYLTVFLIFFLSNKLHFVLWKQILYEEKSAISCLEIYQRREKGMFPLRTSAAAPFIRLCALVKINECQKRLVFLRTVAKEKETCIKKLVVSRAY